MLPVSGAAQLVACPRGAVSRALSYPFHASHPTTQLEIGWSGRRRTYLARSSTLPQLLSHQAIFHIAEARTLLEMILGQKHVEQAALSRLFLKIFHDRRVAVPSLVAGTQLRRVDSVGGYAHFFDESLDLCR